MDDYENDYQEYLLMKQQQQGHGNQQAAVPMASGAPPLISGSNYVTRVQQCMQQAQGVPTGSAAPTGVAPNQQPANQGSAAPTGVAQGTIPGQGAAPTGVAQGSMAGTLNSGGNSGGKAPAPALKAPAPTLKAPAPTLKAPPPALTTPTPTLVTPDQLRNLVISLSAAAQAALKENSPQAPYLVEQANLAAATAAKHNIQIDVASVTQAAVAQAAATQAAAAQAAAAQAAATQATNLQANHPVTTQGTTQTANVPQADDTQEPTWYAEANTPYPGTEWMRPQGGNQRNEGRNRGNAGNRASTTGRDLPVIKAQLAKNKAFMDEVHKAIDDIGWHKVHDYMHEELKELEQELTKHQMATKAERDTMDYLELERANCLTRQYLHLHLGIFRSNPTRWNTWRSDLPVSLDGRLVHPDQHYVINANPKMNNPPCPIQLPGMQNVGYMARQAPRNAERQQEQNRGNRNHSIWFGQEITWPPQSAPIPWEIRDAQRNRGRDHSNRPHCLLCQE